MRRRSAHRPVRFLGAAMLCVALTILYGGGSVMATASDDPVAQQNLLTLLPYRLQAGDLPAGYTLYEEVASTNAALAFAAPSAGRAAALRDLTDSRRVTGLQQTFVQSGDTDATVVRLVLALYADQGAAGAAVAVTEPPGADGTAETLPAPGFGVSTRALHVASTAGEEDEQFLIVWSSGPLLLAVTVQGPDATFAQAQTFAVIAQSHAMAPPVASTSPDRSVQPRDEAMQLTVAAVLDGAQVAAPDTPPAFRREGAYLWSNEQLVLDARQPVGMAHTVAADWGRLTGVAEYFTATDGSRAVLTSAVATYRDAAGAGRAVGDASLSPSARQAIIPFDAPTQLGDETYAFKAVLLWPRREVRDSYTVQWRRSSVVLTVTVNVPPQSPTPSYLAAVAAALDQSFTANQALLSGSVR